MMKNDYLYIFLIPYALSKDTFKIDTVFSLYKLMLVAISENGGYKNVYVVGFLKTHKVMEISPFGLFFIAWNSWFTNSEHVI